MLCLFWRISTSIKGSLSTKTFCSVIIYLRQWRIVAIKLLLHSLSLPRDLIRSAYTHCATVCMSCLYFAVSNTHTYTTVLHPSWILSGTSRVSWHQKGKTNLGLLEQDIASDLPSVLWHCWLGGRKGTRPVKNWVVGCWRGCMGWGADFEYSLADATATHCLLLQ